MVRKKMKNVSEINEYQSSGALKGLAVVGGLLYALKKISQKKEKKSSTSKSGCSPCK